MGAEVYLQLWDLRKHRTGEGRAFSDFLAGGKVLSLREVNKGQKFGKMVDLPKPGHSSTATGWGGTD